MKIIIQKSFRDLFQVLKYEKLFTIKIIDHCDHLVNNDDSDSERKI